MKRWLYRMAAVMLVALVAVAPAFAIPKIMSYQGRLNDKNGQPVNGTITMTFTIWSDETGIGNDKKLWQETQGVTIVNGTFLVKLGAVAPLPEPIFETNTGYLGIKIGTDDEMTPRQQITSAAYSLRSATSEDVNTNFLRSLVAMAGIAGYREPDNARAVTFNTPYGDGNVSKAATDCCYSLASSEYVAGGLLYDNCDDGNIDTTRWTSSGCSEGTESLGCGYPASVLTSNGSNPLNMNSGVTYVVMDLAIGGEYWSPSALQITNGTTDITLYAFRGNLSRTAVLLKIDATTNLANGWWRTSQRAWNHFIVDVDISAATTNKYLRYRSGGSWTSLALYKIHYYQADIDSNLVTIAKQVAESTRVCVVGMYSGNVTLHGSLDGGVTYSAVDTRGMAVLTPGTSMMSKAVLRTNGNESPSTMSSLSIMTVR